MNNRRKFINQAICAGCALLADPLKGSAFSYSSEFSSGNAELWKWSRESIFWEDTPRGVRCMVCPNECTLKPGETSQCRNRISHNGKLYSIAYGNPCAVHIDPMEKKPLFHFHPGWKVYSVATAGCNFACLNCQNWTISQFGPKETKNYDLLPEALVKSCITNKCEAIAYTYSEPTTFYEYMYDSARLARQAGIKTTMHSNGYIKEKPLTALCQYLDAANIDLKAFSEEVYLKLSGGKLEPVLQTLKNLRKNGVWLEITSLLIPGWTDNPATLETQCKWLVDNGFADTPIHFSRFMPLYKLTNLAPTPVNILNSARETAMKAGMNYVYIGNVPGTPAENTYCPSCKKAVVERKGYKVLLVNITNNQCDYCKKTIPGKW